MSSLLISFNVILVAVVDSTKIILIVGLCTETMKIPALWCATVWSNQDMKQSAMLQPCFFYCTTPKLVGILST